MLAENVAGHITMGLDEVLSDLEGQGYAARPFVIPACAVDAPHRRDRVWIIAHANGKGESNGSEHEKRLEDVTDTQNEGVVGRDRKQRDDDGGSGRRVFDEGRGRADDGAEDVANSKGKRLEGCEDARGAGVGGPHSNKQLGGCGEGNGRFWLPEPRVGRVAHGVPNRMDRLKGLGNAVVPQIVEQIGRAIIEAEYAV